MTFVVEAMKQPPKFRFKRLFQPAIFCLLAPAGIGLATGFYLKSYLLVTTCLCAISAVVTVRNWLYFSSLDASEVERTEPLTSVMPWLGLVWISSFFALSFASNAFKWMPTFSTAVLILASLAIGFLNVWYPRYLCKERFREQTKAANTKQNIQKLREEYYSSLDEGRPIDWKAQDLPKERRLELMSQEILAVYALTKLNKTDSRRADVGSLIVTLASLPAAIVVELIASLLVKWHLS